MDNCRLCTWSAWYGNGAGETWYRVGKKRVQSPCQADRRRRADHQQLGLWPCKEGWARSRASRKGSYRQLFEKRPGSRRRLRRIRLRFGAEQRPWDVNGGIVWAMAEGASQGIGRPPWGAQVSWRGPGSGNGVVTWDEKSASGKHSGFAPQRNVNSAWIGRGGSKSWNGEGPIRTRVVYHQISYPMKNSSVVQDPMHEVPLPFSHAIISKI